MTEVCELDVASRSIVGGSDSPADLDPLCQVRQPVLLMCSGTCWSGWLRVVLPLT